MNTRHLRRSLVTIITSLMLINAVWAGAPVWTFAPVAGYSTSISISPSEAALIKYTVTNQSHKPHTLKMKPIQGITSSGCASSLGYHQSCILALEVLGSGLKGDVLGGPILCDHSSPNQCYQPSQANSLAIRLTQTPPVQQYTVTSSAGSNGTISPSGAQTVNSGASLTFTATPASGYGVSQWIVDGIVAQTGGTTYQLTNITSNQIVNVTFDTVTLTPSVSTLGLSVNCPSSSSCTIKNDALTGMPRKITITNTGSLPATNVAVSHSGLPSDASVSSLTCPVNYPPDTIPAGGTCEITVTPGTIASSNASTVLCTAGVQPEGKVTVTTNGAPATSIDVYILSYGCIYQGGFIYSVDDTTADTGSIGGKTAAVTDTYAGQTGISSPGIPNWGGYGIDISPNLYETNTQGANDGSANSALIISSLTPSTSLSDYAAGLCSTLSVDESGSSSCTAPNVCYTSWYLPAMCELGPNSSYCTSGNTNIQQQLFDNTLIPKSTLGLIDDATYWSSTENSLSPDNYAWFQYFSISYGGGQGYENKNGRRGVRCSRVLTL